MSGVAFGNGRFIAVGGTNALTSTDGATWIPSESGTATNLSAITYGNGIFVGVGARGSIQTSPDGGSWDIRFSGTPRTLFGIAYGNSRFVAVGNAATILTSADGVAWTNVSGFTGILYGVTYGNGTFVAVGFPSVTTGFSTILTSPDGFTWTERTPGSVKSLQGAAYGNGAFVVVGDQSTILQSGRGLSLAPVGFGPTGFELTVEGGIGSVYKLQASTDLNAAGWVDLITFTNAQTAMSLTDTAARAYRQRFYRIVSP